MPNPCQNYALKAPTSLPDVQDLKPSTSIRMPTSGRLGHVDPVGRFPTYPVSNNVNFELVYEAHDRIKLMLILLSWLFIFCSACMLVYSVLPTKDLSWLLIVFQLVHISCNIQYVRKSSCWQHFGFCSLLLHHFFFHLHQNRNEPIRLSQFSQSGPKFAKIWRWRRRPQFGINGHRTSFGRQSSNAF